VSDEEEFDLEAELDEIRAAAPNPDQIFTYLILSYRLFSKAAKSEPVGHGLKKLHSERFPKTRRNFAATIVEATAISSDRRGMKHKYVSAMQYAYAKKIKAKDFIDFIKNEGGLNACTEAWRRRRWQKTSTLPSPSTRGQKKR
jgi:hypothetical protein